MYNSLNKDEGGIKMGVNVSKFRILSGNTLKIIAAISMFFDHFGILFFPGITAFRIIGRLAFPIFAFMIAEGCKYTKHRLRYFLTMSLMGAAYTLVYYIYSGKIYFCILVTFACSIALIFALQEFKRAICSKETGFAEIFVRGITFVALIVAVFFFTKNFTVDYGFIGCITPVLASLCHSPRENAPEMWKKLDCLLLSIAGLAIGLVILSVIYGGFRVFSLCAIPLLLLYSGKRGRLKMKYFFYVFYPAHLLLLEGAAMLLSIIQK